MQTMLYNKNSKKQKVNKYEPPMIINWLRISGIDLYSPSYLFWNSKYVVNIDIINYKIKVEQFLKLDNDNPIEDIKDKFLKNKTFISSDEMINSSNIIASKKIQPLLNFLKLEEKNVNLKKTRNNYQSNNIELENISNFIMKLEKENELIPMKMNIMDFLKRIENKPFKNPKGSNLIEKSIILLLLNDIDNCLYYNQGSINFTNTLMKKCIKIYKEIYYLHKNANRMNLIAKNSKKELNNSYSALPKREKYNTNLETQKILLLQKNVNTKTKKADKLKKDAEKYPFVNNIIIQLLAWERNKIYDIINSVDIKNKKIYLKNDSDNIPKIYEYSLDKFSEMIKKGFFNNFFLPNGKLTEYYYTGVGLSVNNGNDN